MGAQPQMDDIFKQLALYHATQNLPACVPGINSGSPAPDAEEFDRHPGVLILKNGPQTIGDLVKQKLVNPGMIDEARSVSNPEELHDYLRQFGGEDGVHVLDTSNGLMYLVYQVENKLSTQPTTPFLPANFVGNVPLHERRVGNKTRLAAHLPREMAKLGTHFETYLIRQTPINGVGPLAHFTSGGLEEFMYRNPGVIGDGSSQADAAQANWTYERYGQGAKGPERLESGLWSLPRGELLRLTSSRDYEANRRVA